MTWNDAGNDAVPPYLNPFEFLRYCGSLSDLLVPRLSGGRAFSTVNRRVTRMNLCKYSDACGTLSLRD